jgi:tetrahydromethanopterin S-methyltransferase subunit G
LVKAVQEQEEKITLLKNENKELKTRLENLEQKIESLLEK